MAWLGVKNGHQNDMWDNEIGLCAQIIDLVLGSIMTTIGRVYGIVSRE